MWFGKKKKVDAPQIDIDGAKLKHELRETYHETVGKSALPPMDEKELKRYFDKWMMEIPGAFKKAILGDNGKGRSEVWLFESTSGYSDLTDQKFRYAANLFAASLKRCLGLSAKVETGNPKTITLNTKELRKFFETPDPEEEKQLHQMGIYR